MDDAVNRTYRVVIADVVDQIKPDFVADGVDEAVLDELRVLWEQKLRASGALKQELRVPPPAYGLPGSAMTAQLGSLLPALGAAPQSLPSGRVPPGGSAAHPHSIHTAGHLGAALAAQQAPAHALLAEHQREMERRLAEQHAAFAAAQAPLQVKREGGASSAAALPGLAAPSAAPSSSLGPPAAAPASAAAAGPSTALREEERAAGDGRGEGDGEQGPAKRPKLEANGLAERRESLVLLSEKHVGEGSGSGSGGGRGSGKGVAAPNGAGVELGDQGETFSDVEDSEEEEDAAGAAARDMVLTQFEKVTRTKNKWKVVLKHGVVRCNKKDYMFHEATGEMEF